MGAKVGAFHKYEITLLVNYYNYVFNYNMYKPQCSKFFWHQGDERVELHQLDQTEFALLVAAAGLLFCGLCVGVMAVLFRRRRRSRLSRTSSTRNFSNNILPKTYDAFVSYVSRKADEHFVYRVLLPKLEKEMGLRLCVHHRDFTPGEGKLRLSYTTCDILKDFVCGSFISPDKFQLE